MNIPRDPDTILAAWLEEGPTALPVETARAIDVTTRVTPQRRPARRRLRSLWTMSIPSRVAAAAVIGVLVGGAFFYLGRPDQTTIGGPTPTTSAAASPSAVATPSAAPQPFTSTRYGYFFEKPAVWQAAASIREWAHGEVISPDLDSVDRFLVPAPVPAGQPAAPTAILEVASQPIAPDKTPESWLDGYRARFQRANHAACKPSAPSDWEAFTVAGVNGLILRFTCDSTIKVADFIAVRGERGWVISGDELLVEQLIPSFQFPGIVP